MDLTPQYIVNKLFCITTLLSDILTCVYLVLVNNIDPSLIVD